MIALRIGLRSQLPGGGPQPPQALQSLNVPATGSLPREMALVNGSIDIVNPPRSLRRGDGAAIMAAVASSRNRQIRGSGCMGCLPESPSACVRYIHGELPGEPLIASITGKSPPGGSGRSDRKRSPPFRDGYVRLCRPRHPLRGMRPHPWMLAVLSSSPPSPRAAAPRSPTTNTTSIATVTAPSAPGQRDAGPDGRLTADE